MPDGVAAPCGRCQESLVNAPGVNAPGTHPPGFTLLETLVAIVILSVAAAIVLDHVRGLIDYVRRSQVHYRDVQGMLNRAAGMGLKDLGTMTGRLRDDHIELVPPGESSPIANVYNVPFSGVLVPIDKAYSPYQLYVLPGTLGRDLPLVLPGLKPPKG
jgi:prepilin-type N-terminal cleavage/methylation domain-containing protein